MKAPQLLPDTDVDVQGEGTCTILEKTRYSNDLVTRYQVFTRQSKQLTIAWNGAHWLPYIEKEERPCVVPGFTYAWMIPYLSRICKDVGYALAVHGSMSRDLDLIAVPWTPDAIEPDALAERMAKMVDGQLQGERTEKLHHRLAYTITFKDAWHFIDLSIMPPTQDE